MSDCADIAILCTGPSLRQFLAAPVKHDLYIGVNRAVVVFPCDWWAFHDAPVFGYFEPQGHPRLFTSNETFRQIAEANPAEQVNACDWLFYAQIETACPSSPGWTNFSVTVAMVLAEYLIRQSLHDASPKELVSAAPRVTLYGCDQKGTDDWDGPPPHGDRRSDYRWGNEIHKFGHVSAWLERQGIAVHRAGAEAGP